MNWTGDQYKGKPELYASQLGQDDVEHIENSVLHFQGRSNESQLQFLLAWR